MIHDYTNPNTCYVIGDSFAEYLGTAAESRVPASGVAEEVSDLNKDATTDIIYRFDGTTATEWMRAAVKTTDTEGAANATRMNTFNMAIKITPAVYVRKLGTTDLLTISGVQVDA